MKRLYSKTVKNHIKHSRYLLETYLTTLSMLWKTNEFRHIAIATALFPNTKQNVLMNSRLDCGKTQKLSMHIRLTK